MSGITSTRPSKYNIVGLLEDNKLKLRIKHFISKRAYISNKEKLLYFLGKSY